MSGTLLTFGHGYTAAALARRLLPKGWRMIGTTRSPDKAERLAEQGVEPLIWPGVDLEEALSDVTHLLISAGPGEAGDPVLLNAADAIAGRAKQIGWIGYLSTTGVYGDHGGNWVDEKTPVAPSTKRGVLRVKAEKQWSEFAKKMDLPLMIFRLAGIYGPGRGPFAKVRAGSARRIVKPGQVFSRIHVDDIAQILEGSIQSPRPGAIYNVCDDMPAPPQDVIAYAADLLGVPRPPEIDFAQADLGPMARSFYAESKRVRNDLIKDELGVRLIYPDYRTGLQALLAMETTET